MTRLRFILLPFIGVIISLNLNAQVEVAFDLNRILRATVLIIQTVTTNTGTHITCVSSGTIVSRDGIILTNAHSTVPNAACNGDAIYVALAVRADEPPVISYQAQVLQSDIGLDLALLRITAEANGRAIAPTDLSLPFVELADSSTITLDETITLTGYAGMAQHPVNAVSATIIGFVAEPRGGEKAWLKFRTTDSQAEIPGVFSGGGAYNRDGRLIGIPATAPTARQSDGGDCARFQDTNRDGLITSADACVPLGGTINALRPSDFALPLIRSASLNLSVFTATSASPIPPTGLEPRISNAFFSPSANNDMPTTVISRLPGGTSSLFLFFDYDFMTPETVYELRVTIDGNTSPIFSLPPARWAGGSRGLWYLGLTGQTLPNGEYNFRLLVNGVLAAEAPPLRVGGVPDPTPTFRNIQFVLIEDGQMFGNGYILGVGPTVSAQFIYDNMTNGLTWTGIWYFNGQELAPRVGGSWDAGPNGAQTTSITAGSGLLPGTYRLSLYIEGRLSAQADFTIAGERGGARPQIFTNERFVVAPTLSEAVTAPVLRAVTTPTDTLYALFDWQSIAVGTPWRLRLSVDGNVFYDRLESWSGTSAGQAYPITIRSGQGRIPDGTYQLELLMNNILLRSITIEIGIGQLPIDPFAIPDGVQFEGQLIDGATGLGIPSATIFILSAEYSVVDFNATDAQLYGTAITDRSGNFLFNRPLQFKVPYSIIIYAEGYLPITADGFTVTNDPPNPTPNPLNLTIYMTRG